MWVLVRENTTNWKLIKVIDEEYITIKLIQEFKVNIFKLKLDFEGKVDNFVI
jgi:uncharacterized protein YeeX (DUF496 family)